MRCLSCQNEVANKDAKLVLKIYLCPGCAAMAEKAERELEVEARGERAPRARAFRDPGRALVDRPEGARELVGRSAIQLVQRRHVRDVTR